ncbi:MAG: hypothetical protein ACRCTZ_11950 [Sarcina sp.]
MNNIGKLVLCISNEFGIPIYNAKVLITSDDINKFITTNLCGIATIDLTYGEYILSLTANEYKGRKFKIKFCENCSFLSLNLKATENKVYGYILDEDIDTNVKVNLLYEVTEGYYVKINETMCTSDGKYIFENVPKGKYKIEAEK